MMEKIYNIYEQNSNMTIKKIKSYLRHDKWWKIDKAIDVGLIDEVYNEYDKNN